MLRLVLVDKPRRREGMGGEERRPRQEGRVVETRRVSLPVLMGGTRREEPSRVALTREGTREDGMRGDERRWTRPRRQLEG